MLAKWCQHTLERKFNVIKYFNMMDLDRDWSKAESMIMHTRQDHYDSNDRYIIEHYDVEYYLPHCPYGLTLHNLIRLFVHCDIPLWTMLIITPVDIQSEMQYIVPDGVNDQPQVLQGLNYVTTMNRGSADTDVDLNIDQIDTHAVTMLGKARTHRNIVFRHLQQNQLLDNVMTSYYGDNWDNEVATRED